MSGSIEIDGGEFADICTERDQLRKERDALTAEVAGLRKDKERLDWLETYGIVSIRDTPYNGNDIRLALDAARKQGS